MDIYVSMLCHGCQFEYLYVNGFFGMDVTMDIAWILSGQGFPLL